MNISDIINEANAKTIFKPVISGGYGHYLTADDAAHIEFVDGNTSSVTVTVEPFKRYVVDSRENGNVTINCTTLADRFYSAEVICNFAAAGQYKIIMTSFDKVEGYESKEIDKSGTYLIHIENWNGYKYAVVNKNDGNVMKSSFEPTLTGLNVTFGSGYIPSSYYLQNNSLLTGPVASVVSSYSWDSAETANGTQIRMSYNNDTTEWILGSYNPKMFVIAKHGTGAYAPLNGVWIASNPSAEFISDYYHIVPDEVEFESVYLADYTEFKKMSSKQIETLISSLYEAENYDEINKIVKMLSLTGDISSKRNYVTSALKKILTQKLKISENEFYNAFFNIEYLIIKSYGTVQDNYDETTGKHTVKIIISLNKAGTSSSYYYNENFLKVKTLHLRYNQVSAMLTNTSTSSWYICEDNGDQYGYDLGSKIAMSDNGIGVNAPISGFNVLSLTNEYLAKESNFFLRSLKSYCVDPNFEVSSNVSGEMNTSAGILPIFIFNSDINKISYDYSYDKCKIYTSESLLCGNCVYRSKQMYSVFSYIPESGIWMTDNNAFIRRYDFFPEKYDGWEIGYKSYSSTQGKYINYDYKCHATKLYYGGHQWPFTLMPENDIEFCWRRNLDIYTLNSKINSDCRHITFIPYDVSLKDPDSIVVTGFNNSNLNGQYEVISNSNNNPYIYDHLLRMNCRKAYQKSSSIGPIYLYCSIINNDRSWIFATSMSYATCDDPAEAQDVIAYSNREIKNGTVHFDPGYYGANNLSINSTDASLSFNYN